MIGNDPYGIASHKAKKKAAAEQETQNQNVMAEMLQEMKEMNKNLKK